MSQVATIRPPSFVSPYTKFLGLISRAAVTKNGVGRGIRYFTYIYSSTETLTSGHMQSMTGASCPGRSPKSSPTQTQPQPIIAPGG